jgi:hypothetical protein
MGAKNTPRLAQSDSRESQQPRPPEPASYTIRDPATGLVIEVHEVALVVALLRRMR